ncbi:MAG: hypothetical protein WC307_01880 [Candidatus Nanoarchaeia archaeon]|jgi:hypothetical protein
MNCNKCGKCCENENTTINVNVLDLTKILEILDNYEFKGHQKKNRGFGEIKKNNQTIVIIREEPFINYKGKWSFVPQAYLAKPCPFIKENLCAHHNKKISNELTNKLKVYDYNNDQKIKICQDHPKFFDYEDKIVKQYVPCSQLEKTIIINDNTIKKESELIGDLQEVLYDYWKITNDYPILLIAEKMIKNKRDPIKPFIRKLNELKRHNGISEENIRNSYVTVNNLLNNTN